MTAGQHATPDLDQDTPETGRRAAGTAVVARAGTERAAIETWAEVLARRFAHIPCLGLRGLLHDGPDGSLQAFLGGLEPEFADELRAALKGSAPGEDAPSLRKRNGEA